MRPVSLCVFLALALALAVPAFSACPPLPEDKQPVPEKAMKIDKGEKCPVCGMFVAKYPDWVARVTFQDGDAAYFDGVKDMFKFLFNLDKYRPGKTREDVLSIHVTEYYMMRPFRALSAYYVLGSDVYGPMGRELIPMATCEDAEAFLKDHKGTRIITFDDVTPALIQSLD